MWDYKKPTKPGLYYVNNGDVVTKESLEVVEFSFRKDEDYLSDGDQCDIGNYHDCYKFMPIDYERLNRIGNAAELELVD